MTVRPGKKWPYWKHTEKHTILEDHGKWRPLEFEGPQTWATDQPFATTIQLKADGHFTILLKVVGGVDNVADHVPRQFIIHVLNSPEVGQLRWSRPTCRPLHKMTTTKIRRVTYFRAAYHVERLRQMTVGSLIVVQRLECNVKLSRTVHLGKVHQQELRLR